MPWNVADDDGKLVLIGPGGDLEFKAEDGDALDVALSGAPFSAADLECEEPDGADPDVVGGRLSGADLRAANAAARRASTRGKSPASRASRSPSSQSPCADDLADPLAERDAARPIMARRRRRGGRGPSGRPRLRRGSNRALAPPPARPQALEAGLVRGGAAGAAGALWRQRQAGDSSSGHSRAERIRRAGITRALIRPFA